MNKILVLTGEDTQTDVHRWHLEELGHKAIVPVRSDEGFRLYGLPVPDVAIINENCSEDFGLDYVAACRNFWPSLSIIVALWEPHNDRMEEWEKNNYGVQDYRNVGATDFLRAPVGKDKLQEKLDWILRRQLQPVMHVSL